MLALYGMVTLDNKISNVRKFRGDLKAGHKDYERAKQGIELIELNKSKLEESLKRYTGFNKLNLPEEPTETPVTKGDITFVILSETRFKKPQYKTAVTGMENYLSGISFLISQKMSISNVFKKGRSTFIAVSKLFEAYDVIVAGIFDPEVKHTISYEAGGELFKEAPLDELVLREGIRPSVLTEENFVNYIRMDKIEPNLVAYIKAYEKELTKGQKKPVKTTPVTAKAAYGTTKSKSEGPDWVYVVKTLITVPTDPENAGELNILNDHSISKAEKERRLPHYRLVYRNADDTQILYVSMQSVSKRIESLKEYKSVEAKRLKVEHKEIV